MATKCPYRHSGYETVNCIECGTTATASVQIYCSYVCFLHIGQRLFLMCTTCVHVIKMCSKVAVMF